MEFYIIFVKVFGAGSWLQWILPVATVKQPFSEATFMTLLTAGRAGPRSMPSSAMDAVNGGGSGSFGSSGSNRLQQRSATSVLTFNEDRYSSTIERV